MLDHSVNMILQASEKDRSFLRGGIMRVLFPESNLHFWDNVPSVTEH
jgi:hypothetical protein